VPILEEFMRTLSLSILTLLSTACIYDNNCPDRQRSGSGVADTADEEGIDSPEYYLSPDASMAGETIILSLQSDQAVDFEIIETLSFLEDISVCTMSARDDELLLTISIHETVLPGAVDIVIELEDGSHIFVESGFTVLDPEADESPGDGGSEEGSEDGSGSGDDGSDEPGEEDDGSTPEGGSQGC